jgi:hypothetical protein
VEAIRIDWDDAADFEVESTEPAVWQRTHQFGTTKETYEFISQMEKKNAKAKAPRISVSESDDEWADLSLGANMTVDSETLQDAVEYVRGLLDEGEVSLDVRSLHFEQGQDLIEWAEDAKVDLNPDEVKQ